MAVVLLTYSILLYRKEILTPLFLCSRRWWHIWSCLAASHVNILMPCHSDSSQPVRQRIMAAVSDTAGRSGGRQAKCTVCLCVSARATVCVCVWVWLYVRPCACAHVCQSEGMDACQRREQHHVRALADDAHFRYTNSNSQLSHETISSHDSSTPFLSAPSATAGYYKVQQQSYLSPRSKFCYSKIISLELFFRKVNIELQYFHHPCQK